jgi:hypothetical protein
MLQTSNEKNFWYPSIGTIFDTLNSSLHHKMILFIMSKVNFLRLHVLAMWLWPMIDNWSCIILVGFLNMMLIMYHEWIVDYLNNFNFAKTKLWKCINFILTIWSCGSTLDLNEHYINWYQICLGCVICYK